MTAGEAQATAERPAVVRTQIPARLDRLPWSRFHSLLVLALGVTWILDGLEVTIVGALGPALQDRATLGLTTTQVGEAASFYLAGAIAGALVFGWLTDRFGRQTVIFLTLGVYLAGVLASALSVDFAMFALFRLVTGLGIGGEYAAINSAIDELIPARWRGRIDLIVNGSFWLGAVAGAAATPLLLDPRLFPVNVGWRLAFAIGGVLGLGILFLRRLVPESPRWLITHGRYDRAERMTARIEARAGGALPLPVDAPILEIRPGGAFGLRALARALLTQYRRRTALVLTLMAAQAFLYNALFFTYGVVLTRFEAVEPQRVGLFILPLAVGNFAGPLMLGHLFDTVGRKPMIAGSYALAGVLMIATALAFGAGALTAVTQTAAWMVIFFFASAAASAAYLTASEIFPLEVRALAIAVFYAMGTLIGGLAAPTLYGALVATGQRWTLCGGYVFAAILMLVAAVVELWLGVPAERQPLEALATPLTAVE
ncbi:MAG: MFS transporter [Caulobacteraceae bacterium]|nr:MFS transporter [Caulobacteraceae bacterium]